MIVSLIKRINYFSFAPKIQSIAFVIGRGKNIANNVGNFKNKRNMFRKGFLKSIKEIFN